MQSTTAPEPARSPESRSAFSWDLVRQDLEGLPAGGLNIGHEAAARHARGRAAGRAALRHLAEDGSRSELTYAALAERAARFASTLRDLGAAPGEPVLALLGRSPALHAAALGALQAGCVFAVLSPAYGPEPARARVARARPRILVTTPALFARRVAPGLGGLPSLEQVLLAGAGAGAGVPGGAGEARGRARLHDLEALLAGASADLVTAPTSAGDLALLHFTSGTTGAPKAALHAHASVLAYLHTARAALDLRPDDIYWCTADPGWVTATVYGLLAPFVVGCTSVVDGRELDPVRWYETVQAERVSVCYTSPTALRLLRRAGDDLPRAYDLSSLRLLASVGEPLDAGLVAWTRDVLGVPARDTWWQTETGSIVIASPPGALPVPGWMGQPVAGAETRVVRRREGGIDVLEEPAATGELALRRDWPSLFRGYLDDPERTEACFAGDWYLTGDLVERDEAGRFRFVGRADDMIKSAGHLIGPAEVEQALLEHPAVWEVGVVGRPDPVAGERVTAVVSLARGRSPDAATRRDLLAHGRARLGAVLAPKEVEFMDALPKTPSGKILRRALRDPAAATAKPDVAGGEAGS
ncbi:MAG TPA: AMP-binding protein [Longimicrobiales bacterium]|nr:AMP-binding protein [Longimicrobiales bacterium]